MKLSQAIEAIAPALVTTPRFMHVALVIDGTQIRAFNGNIMAFAPLESKLCETVAVDSEKFVGIWEDDSNISVGEVFVTVKRGKVSFRVGQLNLDTIVHPEFIPASVLLTNMQQDAIRTASKFASQNAVHPWACGVSITHKGVIATNNQTLVFIPCVFDFELTMPFWAVDLLPSVPVPIMIGWNQGVIAFHFPNHAHLQASRLAVDMPASVGELAAKVEPARDKLPDIQPIVNEIQRLQGRHCVLSPGAITIEGVNGEHAIAETEIKGEFRMTIETAKLVFGHATHIDFDAAPNKLRFSRESYPQLYGFAAGMR